jgi:hypothetical protein
MRETQNARRRGVSRTVHRGPARGPAGGGGGGLPPPGPPRSRPPALRSDRTPESRRRPPARSLGPRRMLVALLHVRDIKTLKSSTQEHGTAQVSSWQRGHFTIASVAAHTVSNRPTVEPRRVAAHPTPTTIDAARGSPRARRTPKHATSATATARAHAARAACGVALLTHKPQHTHATPAVT